MMVKRTQFWRLRSGTGERTLRFVQQVLSVYDD